eukprot:403361792
MRIEATRFGVRTNKTIRKAGNTSVALSKLQDEVVKKSNASHPQIELVNGKLLKSAKNFEKIDKNERKRKLQQNEVYSNQHDEEYDSAEESQEFYVQIVENTKKSKKQNVQESDSDEEETKDVSGDEQDLEDILEGTNDDENAEIRLVLAELAKLQKLYASLPNDEIPEDDQHRIKQLQRQLNNYKPIFENFEGNINKSYRSFTLEKLSGFMNAQQFQRKYLQTGEKAGKYILKADKSTNVEKEGAKKAEKRKNLKNQIKTDLYYSGY